MTSTDAASVSCSAWLIRSAATCARVGGGVGEDGDLGRPGLGVDADHASHQAFRGRHVDVAGAGDHVDGLDLRRVAVGGQRDRLRAADGVHLVDAEQGARGEDRRVRPAAELLLRGENTAIDSTPATCAGTTFITTLDG